VRTKGHVMFWEDVSTSMGYFPDALKTRVCTFQNICVQGEYSVTVLYPPLIMRNDRTHRARPDPERGHSIKAARRVRKVHCAHD